jgi:hypothetical protein
MVQDLDAQPLAHRVHSASGMLAASQSGYGLPQSSIREAYVSVAFGRRALEIRRATGTQLGKHAEIGGLRYQGVIVGQSRRR